MRLDKYLSDATAHSRKELKSFIRRGQVTVNGAVVKVPEFQTDENAQITLNGEPVRYRKFVYLMMNKPAGFISATEDGNAPVVTELLPEEYKHFNLFPAGRLDKDTEGLLILTNDGSFGHRITAPRRKVWKRYFAILDLPAEAGDCRAFAEPMDLGDFVFAPGELHITADAKQVYVDISEGKFHQVKRMCEKVGKRVTYLRRCAIGGVELDLHLAPGECRELSEAELALLEAGTLPELEDDEKL